jgi:CubicO group peptidase (beta-lactamase class C family)
LSPVLNAIEISPDLFYTFIKGWRKMKNQHNTNSHFPLQSRVGVLTVISIATVLIIVGIFLPQILRKGDFQKPPTTGDGWVTASPSEVGMDQKPLADLFEFLAKQDKQVVNGLVVVKNGKLVLEAYFPGDDITVTDKQFFTRKDFDRDTLHCLASATKSVTSIMVGIAYDQGKINDLDEKMFASFPEYADLSDEVKAEITLRHILTMTSGLPWHETTDFNDPGNDLGNMAFIAEDPIEYVLKQQPNSNPGELFQYNSGTTNLLGEIVRRKTGIALPDYARDNLFTPLGINEYEWLSFPSSPSLTAASSLLYLKPRDMAKIGQLYLQLGVWNGVQVVSPKWIQKSTDISVNAQADYAPDFRNTGYGYQWWRGRFTNGNTDTFYAAGWGGQFIFVMPTINTVVVMTGSDYYGNFSIFYKVVNQYILNAIYGSS